MACLSLQGQALPIDGPLTIRPMLQQLGERLLQGKTGSIVAINPANGEILCLATNTPQGADVRQAIGKPQAPGSTFKTAQALTLLSEGIITPQTQVNCVNGVTDGLVAVVLAALASDFDLREGERKAEIQMHVAFLLPDTHHYAVHILMAALDVFLGTGYQNLPGLSHVAGLIFIRDAQRDDVELKEILLEGLLTAHVQHLQQALLRGVDPVLGPTLSLGEPY
jgi:hypothetical protein